MICVFFFILILVLVLVVVIATVDRVALAHLGVEVGEAGHDGVHAHAALHLVVVGARGARLLAPQRLRVGLIGSFQLALVEKAPVLTQALQIGRTPVLGLGVDQIRDFHYYCHVTVADATRAEMVKFVFGCHRY